MRTYSFEAGGKSYTAKFDSNAIADMEEMANKPISLILGDGAGIFTYRLIVWGALKWKDQGITKHRAGMILDKLKEEGSEYHDEVIKNLTILLAKALRPELSEDEMNKMLEDEEENNGGEKNE